MTASLKTPVKANVNKQPQTSTSPTIKTPVVKRQKVGKESEIGACWTKTPLNGGEEYMTGDITLNGVKTSIVMFRNRFKDTELKPDWRIYVRPPLSNVVTTQPVNVPQDQEIVDQNPAFLS